MNSGAPLCVRVCLRRLTGCILAGLLTASSVKAQNSLTAWWAFDGDYTSQVNNDLFGGSAIGGGTGFTGAPGQFVNGSQGLRIDGTSGANYVDITASPILDLTASITVSAWYQYNDLDGLGSDERNFVWETAPGNYPLSFGIRDRAGKRAQWFTQSPDLSNGLRGPAINEGVWYHAAVVIDQSNNSLQYYHNGSLIDDVSLPRGYSMPPGNGFHIGNHRAGEGTRNWDGYIDDVAVFQGALNQTEVSSLYNQTATPLSLVGAAVTTPPPPPEPQPDPIPPAPGSWTMVILPDTQNYATNNPAIFQEMTEWIVDNRDERSIGLVQHVGDITNRNNDLEFGRMAPAFALLDGEVPYIVAQGNHDIGPNGAAGNRRTTFNDYFDESIYYDETGGLVYDNLKIADQFVDTRRLNNGIIDSSASPDGKTLENTAYEFTAPDGREMLIFALEWGVRQEVIDWANTVAGREEYEDHTAVLLTHAYLYSDSERYDWTNKNTDNDVPGNTFSGAAQGANPYTYGTADLGGDPGDDTNDGEDLWRELVSQHGNFEMTFNGHVIIGGQLGFRTDAGADGQTVNQMLFNAQADANGGDGWLRLLEFLPDGETVQVKTFSPYRESLGLDAWRTDPANQFTFKLTNTQGIPEPTSATVLAIGALGMFTARRLLQSGMS